MRAFLLALFKRFVRWLDPDGGRAPDWGRPAFKTVLDQRAATDHLTQEILSRRDSIESDKGILPELARDEAMFASSTGPLEVQHVWDKRLEKYGGPKMIPYEELEGMFLDQFLLRFFHSLMPDDPLASARPGAASWLNVQAPATSVY